MKDIIYLHTNTEYSFLNSTIRLDELFNLAKSKKVKYLTLTDFENFHALQFYWNFQNEYDFKLILGLELNLKEGFKIIALAKNDQGFLKLKELVLAKSNNLPVSYYDLNDPNLYLIDHFEEGFKAKNLELDKLFNNFYLNDKKMQAHQTVYAPTKKILYFDDNELLPILNNIGNLSYQKKLYSEYYEPGEFDNVDEGVYQNILNIVQSINLSKPSSDLKLPKYSENSKEDLQKLINNHAYQELIKKYDKDLVDNRIKLEYQVIKKLGFIDYFLIIQDVIKYAKQNNILIGPGRGSASGSLISYLIGITSVNPLEFDLLFERFLNLERIGLPDIDIDIQDNKRDELFWYLANKYGFDKVAFISTFQTLASKNSLRDVGRYLGISKAEIDEISASISSHDASLLEAYEKNKKYALYAKKYPQLHLLASRIEGLPRQLGIHAAGFIISNISLINLVPIQVSNFKLNQLQMTMNNLEQYGLIKIDFLGLKNLTFINELEQEIPKELHFEQIINDSISLFNDKPTFDLLNSTLTDGIFQLESPGMRNAIKEVVIDKFDDIYAVLSLFRPGPSKYIKTYAKNKANPLFIEKVHPLYDNIVKHTYGIIVYQEQIMQIVQDVANMSFSKADLFRRAISKKKEGELKLYRDEFFAGGLKNGFNETTLQKIYSNIEKFADYGFNKSHAVAYGIISYKLAYYKARFPMIFYKVLLSNIAVDQNTIKMYAEEAALFNIKVKIPNINLSTEHATLNNKEIYLSFALIKGIGQAAIDKILTERNRAGKFTSFISSWLRLKASGLGESILETLIKAGSFNNFANLATLLSSLDICQDFYELFKFETKNHQEPLEYLDTFIKKHNLGDHLLNLKDHDKTLEDQWEIKLLGNKYTNEVWSSDARSNQNLNKICLASLQEKAQYLKVEILSVTKGAKDNQLKFKLQDESKVVTASSWSGKFLPWLNVVLPQKVRVLALKKGNFYNIKDIMELIDEE
ncbi:DNA polymerase III subunit alpha [Mycoplasmopsis bovirhinis]|uniref:DNA polymerase III subunit alpha n=1 Tax=Mycoplasmopsis bovirhinis TaxID=29553 RepID=UPI000C05888E|nr:DNA polymerase III subunit alpha [Mycoplasmopsis bovirhinis]ATO30904.1 DNA polymerase III subunit alpha [Mycoplasmopsis bovirhinis]